MSLSFDFGANWQEFSAQRLDAQRVSEAQDSLRVLLGDDALAGRSFLDIGCGSGLFSIAAAARGARSVRGFDVNATAVETSSHNAQRFLSTGSAVPEFSIGSILDDDFVAQVGRHDIVYAWGSLHHTGSMWKAIRNAAQLVAPGGTFVLAIYNAHWSSGFWTQVKRIYNLSPAPIRKLMTATFGTMMYLGVWAITRRNPMQKERGMDFWYDVVDWLGGYPFEVATPEQLSDFLEPLGFNLASIATPRVPTGCNELVFHRTAGAS